MAAILPWMFLWLLLLIPQLNFSMFPGIISNLYFDIHRQHLKCSYCHSTDLNTASQRILSFNLHYYVSETQFKVLDVLMYMSILLGYQLPRFNQGFSPFAAAVTGFKLLANIDLNLVEAARLVGLLPIASILKRQPCDGVVLMSKPFKGGPSLIAQLPHALRVHIEETICRELKQRHAAVIGDACIALIYIALVFTLFGAIVYFIHSRLQNAHVADRAPAVDDGNVEGIHRLITHLLWMGVMSRASRMIAHPLWMTGMSRATTRLITHLLWMTGTFEGTHADPDSTPRILWEDKPNNVAACSSSREGTKTSVETRELVAKQYGHIRHYIQHLELRIQDAVVKDD
ncbi:hypothetical protein BU17DRAFT_67835 [Hysterangium stoloniferum]|nr:hypothetical protein BU17DRAFT_67835 [Hysterangium stoloniferum]